MLIFFDRKDLSQEPIAEENVTEEPSRDDDSGNYLIVNDILDKKVTLFHLIA
jgi:hypothetical protein